MKTAEPIAIVGIGCRFPGDANNPDAYWEMLINRVNAISEVPEGRWNLKSHFNEDKSKAGKTYTRRGGFINDIDKFDADFFGISPREAACMDPQQRILLETCWEALADAGIDPDKIAGTNVGTFMGIFTHDYNNMQLDTSNRDLIDTHTGVGVSMSIVANRISYAFDFTGPSVTMDTACSSSLVAMHMACQSIRNGESTIAVAGGANALIKPEFTIATSKASMLSPDGHCKSFDASANGYVRSEGAGVIVLKHLSEAIKDNDDIYAVIKGSVVNQDGKSDGITVPNQKSQIAAIRKALEISGVAPEEVSYAEAHGTGTFVGDPIEANSIGSVLGESRSTDLIIGSVKSNIGHLEAASGVASLVKVAMSLKNKRIAPNIHFNTPNPQIEFEKYHLRVPVEAEDWTPDNGGPRYACINSFGFGGTNATFIITEAPQQKTPEAGDDNTEKRPYILPLSANSQNALDALVDQTREHIKGSADSLKDICYSAAVRSGHKDHRVALVGPDKNKILDLADAFMNGQDNPFISKGSNSYSNGKLAFVFSGMGTQWWAMGRQMMDENAIFRDTIERCDELLSKHADWSLKEELMRDEENTRINGTQFAQPAIFAVEIALAKVWESYGIIPDVVCGHSVGEVAAAYVSGALSLEDAIKVIYFRSLLQQKTAGMGGMLAVSISKDKAVDLIAEYGDKISVAAINSPTSVTLAGESDLLKKVEEKLSAQKILCRPLRVEVPFHSAAMEVIKDELIESLQAINPKETSIPLYSTVTSNLIPGTELDANYWWSNVREPVEFSKTINNMHDCEIFLEVGPHPVLLQSMNESFEAGSNNITLSSLRRKRPEAETLYATLASLHTHGYPLNWDKITMGKFVKRPTYPWQRLSFWRESEVSAQDRIGNMQKRTMLLKEAHPLLGNKLDLALNESIWEADVQIDNLPYLNGHKINDAVVFPGAGFIEMALAATFSEGRAAATIKDFSFEKALILNEDGTKMQSVLKEGTFTIYSEKRHPGDRVEWIKHASAKPSSERPSADTNPESDIQEIRNGFTLSKNKEEIYGVFEGMGFQYESDFSSIENFDYNESEALAQISLSNEPDDIYKTYPPLLDNAFQTLLGIITCSSENPIEDQVFLPVQISKLTAYHHIGGTVANACCHAQITEHDERGLKGDLKLYDSKGKTLLSIEGLYCVSVDKDKWQAIMRKEEESGSNDYHEVKWTASEFKSADANASTAKQWLVFNDSSNHGQTLADQFNEHGQKSTVVSNDDYTDALKSIKSSDSPGGIIYLWPLDNPPLSQSSDPSCGCARLLTLLQSMNELGLELPLWIITQGGQFIHPEPTRLEQSPFWGFANVIALEQPQLQCHCVDMDPNAGAESNISLLRHTLLQETSEDRLAFRNGKLLHPRLEPSSFAFNRDNNNNSITEDGTYLITGAFGGLGRLVARKMIDLGARNLVLMGRRGAAGNESFLSELGNDGIKIHAATADVCKRSDVEPVIGNIRDNMPPLRGIIHAAGVLDDGVITQQTPDRFAKIMEPKVQGSWNLHELTRDCPLDFFVCFSSVASLIGSPGQSNYAAGNAFMDSLSHYRRSLGLPAISINWGPWKADGMAAAQLKRLEAKGFGAIDAEAGLQAFAQLLNTSDIAQIGVAPINWKDFSAAFPDSDRPFFPNNKSSTEEEEANNTFLERLADIIDAEKNAFLLEHIDEIVNAVFGYGSSDKMDRQKSLFDNGLDSLMALEIKNRLESSLQLTLPSTLLFEHPSINNLGDFLSSKIEINSGSAKAEEDETEQDLIKELNSMSDEELNALLENELSDS